MGMLQLTLVVPVVTTGKVRFFLATRNWRAFIN